MANISLHYRAETPLLATLSAVGQLLATWRRRSRDRHELATMDHRTMRDLGISPTDIQFEANKPFWRV